MKITLCAHCPGYSVDYLRQLAAAVAEQGIAARVATAACMQGCARPVALSVRASGKMAYLFGETGPADLPDILTFLGMYAASADGDLPDARPLGRLRFKAIARIPA